jgi:hypothetical protein
MSRERYMVICRETKAEGARRDQYTVATQSVFTDLTDAIEFAEGIAPGRRPRVLAYVWPEEEADIYVDDEGHEYLFVADIERKGEAPIVWLLDEDDKRIGMTRTAFERKLRRKGSE